MSTSVQLGNQLAWWTLAPFGLMLFAIAVLPLAAGHWFHSNRNKAIVAFVIGAPTLVFLVVRFGHLALRQTGSTAEQYVSFLVLLFALFTVSGGIHLTGNEIARPRTNVTFLLAGAVLASLIGTMGASMVLIRPLLRANSERTRSRHTIVFFIFLAGNVGGLLTPLGPPLFLGFLRGVPFAWTLRLWAEWLLVIGLSLVAYLVVEIRAYRKEPQSALDMDRKDYVPMRIKGGMNILPLLLIIATVLFSGPLGRAGDAIHFPFVREVILVALAMLSLALGPRGPRAANHFNWRPIVEVAVLFAGIFATMIPALALLQARGGDIGLTQPWHYFWASGGLSSFLDNAPAYLALSSVAQGQVGAATLGGLTATHVVAGMGVTPAQLLAAISCGSALMGANTYIGNAPNFAIKAIAEHAGLKMPSFFGYMAYSGAVLIPIFAVVTALFFL